MKLSSLITSTLIPPSSEFLDMWELISSGVLTNGNLQFDIPVAAFTTKTLAKFLSFTKRDSFFALIGSETNE